MHVDVHILQQALELYLQFAYPAGVPAGVEVRAVWVRGLPNGEVPLDPQSGTQLEKDAANAIPSYALRLGQPMYPHMKLVIDPAPEGGTGPDYLLRVDSHDRHLHAPPGSPDAAWLTSVRLSNKELGEKIEGAWEAAGLPTFKTFLKRQLAERKRSHPA